VSEQDVHCALLSGDPQDQLVIAYNLVIDNRRIADETAKLQIHDFYLASSPPSEAFLAVPLLCLDVVSHTYTVDLMNVLDTTNSMEHMCFLS